jgi:hypothetical protein
MVRCVGISGKIRGKSEGRSDGSTIRPDFVVIDDVQTDDDAINPKRVKKLESKINKSIRGLVADGDSAAVVMSCTVIEPNDLADRYLNREIYPIWNGLRFAMIRQFPARADLWEKYCEIRRKESPELASRFYKTNREPMDAEAVVDWPENFDKRYASSRLE